eukprot:TRINITY_DN96878_c0_g1_i1.p1 TRINITY_DN96878_c0_g1~~TRINITY_DN96878_c0_g1_i1.p1  ORF type:complete len:367 (-),score=73.79 TRINITY_DN96878_c0_g1_i1:34-984(-)
MDAVGEMEIQSSRMLRTETKMPADDRHDKGRPGATALEMDASGQLEMEALSNQSLHLDARLQAVANDLKPHTSTKDFLLRLSLCVPCSKFERFGHSSNDKGWVMCTDDLHDKGVVAAYSYGVSGPDAWGMDVASRYQIPLHEYAKDCIDPAKPGKTCEGCSVTFHTDCVTGARAPTVNLNFKSLQQNLQDNKHLKDSSILLKLDASGAEWEVFAEAPVETLQKFRQVAVKFSKVAHQEKHALYERAVRKLEESGFAVAFLRGSNFTKLSHLEEDGTLYNIPDDLEVTYMQLPSQGCSRDLKFKVPEDAPDVIRDVV